MSDIQIDRPKLPISVIWSHNMWFIVEGVCSIFFVFSLCVSSSSDWHQIDWRLVVSDWRRRCGISFACTLSIRNIIYIVACWISRAQEPLRGFFVPFELMEMYIWSGHKRHNRWQNRIFVRRNQEHLTAILILFDEECVVTKALSILVSVMK